MLLKNYGRRIIDPNLTSCAWSWMVIWSENYATFVHTSSTIRAQLFRLGLRNIHASLWPISLFQHTQPHDHGVYCLFASLESVLTEW